MNAKAIRIHGGLNFQGTSSEMTNIELEQLDTDPIGFNFGRLWQNKVDYRIKYSLADSIKTVATLDDVQTLTDLLNSKADKGTSLEDYGIINSISDTRIVSLTGDIVGSGTIRDGITSFLGSTGVTAGSYGTDRSIPSLIVDDKGRSLSVQDVTIKPHVLDTQGGLGWKDITSDLTIKSGSSAPSIGSFMGVMDAYLFSPNSVDKTNSVFHIPHDYAPGTAIYIHMHWADPSPVITGTVRWAFTYTIAKGHGQEAFSTPVTTYVEQVAVGQNYHMVAEMPVGILSASIEPDAIVIVKIFRDYTHVNDTCTASVYGFNCDIHYQADRIATLNKAPNFYY